MSERTEEAGLSGLLTVVMDGRPYEVPVLKLRQSREWKAKLGAIVSEIEIPDAAAPGALLGALADVPAEVALEIVLAYDVTGVLGDRDGIEDAATDADLYRALGDMVTVTYPKYPDALRFLVAEYGPRLWIIALEAMSRVAEALSPEKSPSSPSPTGDSTPTPLKIVSPTNSSSSSGPMAKRGSGARRKTG